MAADFCVEALEEALAKFGAPEIFNTDQGAQFTGSDFIGVLMEFFNRRRPHSALDRRTPDAVYFGSLPLAAAA
jgi:transposase InsO family protein